MTILELARFVSDYGAKVNRRITLAIEAETESPPLGYFMVRSIDNGPVVFECCCVFVDDINEAAYKAYEKFSRVLPENAYLHTNLKGS